MSDLPNTGTDWPYNMVEVWVRPVEFSCPAPVTDGEFGGPFWKVQAITNTKEEAT